MIINISDDVRLGVSQVDAIYLGDVLVYSREATPVIPAPPIYLMTEPLNHPDTFYYLNNSASSGVTYDGKLLTSNGNEWLPTLGVGNDYPYDGTIELGSNSHTINTQWIPPSDSEWFIRGAYDITKGLNYGIYQLHYKGNGKIDIYSGSYGVPITLTYSDIDYVPPQDTPWIISAGEPELVGVTNVIYKMDSFTTVP